MKVEVSGTFKLAPNCLATNLSFQGKKSSTWFRHFFSVGPLNFLRRDTKNLYVKRRYNEPKCVTTRSS